MEPGNSSFSFLNYYYLLLFGEFRKPFSFVSLDSFPYILQSSIIITFTF
ncbi:hypothetical protein RchiOBHm_Chr2g0109551 [Rosa chinensis]|uniref:Uncharacterized protein n=1 Tax=Rosa chinensis TaxID=74649 RepID=A0A2P6RPJ4_ROSCH|nr:hypothetical protein RchiOBHm_Chr2g0109551 [Rosa chinensis]